MKNNIQAFVLSLSLLLFISTANAQTVDPACPQNTAKSSRVSGVGAWRFGIPALEADTQSKKTCDVIAASQAAAKKTLIRKWVKDELDFKSETFCTPSQILLKKDMDENWSRSVYEQDASGNPTACKMYEIKPKVTIYTVIFIMSQERLVCCGSVPVTCSAQGALNY